MRRPLIITLLGIALSLVCLGIGAVIFFAANDGFRANDPFDRQNIPSQLEESETLNINPERPVDLSVINQAGSVTVTGGDVETVQVDVIKTAYDSSQSRADQEVKSIQYTVEQTNNTITLKYELPDSMNFSNKVNTVDFVVTVPENTSLEVRAGAGNIDVSRLKGPVEVESGFGRAVLEDIQGAISVDSQSGSIRLSQVEAGREDIALATNFGEISLEMASAQSVNISSRSGALQLQDIRLTGDLVASTDFGEITLDQVRASSYDLDSNSGSITVDGVRGRLSAHTEFGSIRVSNATSVALDLLTRSGSIEFAGSLNEGPHSLHSDFGGISLTIPADSAFDVDLSTDFGQISSDIPVTITGNIDEQHQIGTINGGGSELKIQTNSGNVNIQAGQ
ncbi:MAG TPA: DUF4097 family beta strand repeat-containing protein [Anaerolineales bacterium]|nr:DUF4097 family beta strand repeat-containing protein [Anaerolineales bacterium]